MAAFSNKSRLKRLATIVAIEFALGLPSLLAQSASADAASHEQAKKIYAVQCSRAMEPSERRRIRSGAGGKQRSAGEVSDRWLMV